MTSLFRLAFLTAVAILTLGPFSPRVNAGLDPRCARTLIASPTSNTAVGGIVSIIGRATLDNSFARYQVDFSTAGMNLWVLINSAEQPVEDGTLALWDTRTIPEGAYDLRVRTVDVSGNYCEQTTTPVFVGRSTSGGSISVTSDVGIVIPSLYGSLRVDVPRLPEVQYCTRAALMSRIVTRSIRLCPGETYAPFTVVGDNVAIIGDAGRPPIVQSVGRSFGIHVKGNNAIIANVALRASTAPEDVGQWLCVYEQCDFAIPPIKGGAAYGGGVLLEGSNSTVMKVQVQGGVIGIAVLGGRGNRLLDNSLTGLSGWGIFGVGLTNSAIVGNQISDVNRACRDPGGRYFAGGCESAGLLLMGAESNIIANNRCARSGNCYYLNGEGGRLNNFNKLYGNHCVAPSFNCFEITDAQDIEFDRNSAELTPDNDAGCAIWLVRAHVIAGTNNQFSPCNHRGSKLESTFELAK